MTAKFVYKDVDKKTVTKLAKKLQPALLELAKK